MSRDTDRELDGIHADLGRALSRLKKIEGEMIACMGMVSMLLDVVSEPAECAEQSAVSSL